MKTHVIRLTYGNDLKESIKQYCIQNNIQAATILSSVGCLYEVNIRLAGGKDYYKNSKEYEIISLNGTVSINGIHLHISLSGQTLRCMIHIHQYWGRLFPFSWRCMDL